MTLSRDELQRIERLRGLFLAERKSGEPLPDYWRDDRDLAAYDRFLGLRIGWKWDAALTECAERGFARADGEVVLDHGCGTGVAARGFVRQFGAAEVRCHDRSPRAAAFAARSITRAQPGIRTTPVADVAAERPDVLLVSHVLGELDDPGEAALCALMQRSRRVVIVEPGTPLVARRLSRLRDRLLADGAWHVAAPCPHALQCPALARDSDWCHFFAPPPPSAFTDSEQVRMQQAVGVDARALPFAFLALQREPVAVPPPPNRVLGRPEALPHTLRAQLCSGEGLRTLEVQKRRAPELWRTAKKRPHELRSLPAD